MTSNLSFRTKANGVPILSKKEINDIGFQMIMDFDQTIAYQPGPLDIERFLEFYLKMTADYQYLSHNGVYLGMTVFNDTDRIPVYDPYTHRAKYIHADANTVIIDTSLVEEKSQEHRLRFTQAHEAGHAILHKQCFSNKSTGEDVPMIRCRTDFGSMRRNTVPPRNWGDNEWMEWHANSLASALLMPAPAVKYLIDHNSWTDSHCNLIIRTIHDLIRVCNVSHEAALYRLRDLGYIRAEEVRSFSPDSPLMVNNRDF